MDVYVTDISISVSAINSEWVKSMKIFPVTYKVLQRKLSWCPDDNVNKITQQKCFKGSYQILVFDAIIINQSLDFIYEQDCCTCCQWKKRSANILKKTSPYIIFGTENSIAVAKSHWDQLSFMSHVYMN